MMRRTLCKPVRWTPAALPFLLLSLALSAGCGRGADQAKAQTTVLAPITSLAFSPDGKTLAAARHMTIKLWDPDSGQEKRSFDAGEIAFSRVTFSPDGNKLAAGSYDGKIHEWDLATGKELHV